MKIADARIYAANLIGACDAVEKDGRDTLTEADLQAFSDLAAAAIKTLGDTIAEAEKPAG